MICALFGKGIRRGSWARVITNFCVLLRIFDTFKWFSQEISNDYFILIFQSWQTVDLNTAEFSSDITPLIVAAHRNNYEILKILLDRGATIPTPHGIK